MPAPRPSHLPLCSVFRVLITLVLLGSVLACEEVPSSTVPPPTALPTATPGAEQALMDLFYTISFDGRLLGRETLRVSRETEGLVVTSNIQWLVDYPFSERRTVLLSSAFSPLRYDLELDALGGRSTWVTERRNNGMDILSNNQAWYAPVLREGLTPPPEVLLESSPSALPFVLLMLRYTEPTTRTKTTTPSPQWYALDITEDLAVSRSFSMTLAPERKGSLIGTVALEAQVAGGRNAQFTLWIRPNSRALYSVEVTEYRFGVWPALAHPAWQQPGKLVIERVSKLPELPALLTKSTARRLPIEFAGADKTVRSGTLTLPEGTGPFPCLVLHSSAGLVPRWDVGDTFAGRGWAVFAYDKRGLGESEGDYERGNLRLLAQDALAAAEVLRERSEVDPKRIVFMGLDEGGLVGAWAVASGQGYAGAILASCASPGPLFPTQVEGRIRNALAPAYGWNAQQTTAYLALSLQRWQTWFAQGQDEVALLRRRASVRSLKEYAATDLTQLLSQARVPILLMQGGKDLWNPTQGARALYQSLQDAGKSNVTLQVLDALGADLRPPSGAAFSPEAVGAITTWLQSSLP